MNSRIQRICVIAFLFAGGLLAAAKEVRLHSPEGKIEVVIEMPARNSSERPRWSATFAGKRLLSDCRLGLETAEWGELMSGARIVEQRRRAFSKRVAIPFGKADHALDRYEEIKLQIENAKHRRSEVTFRCYDDAVAFRYDVTADRSDDLIHIVEERSSFRVEGEPTAYPQYLENYKTSHEHAVTPAVYSELKKDTLIDLPLTFLWRDGVYAAITEAALRNYAGMSLKRRAPEDSELVSDLTPRNDGVKVTRRGWIRTPWRVVLMADRVGALLESETIYCLNEPSAIKDISWIKPGKITFHWWNGDTFDGERGPSPLSFEFSKKYIDFCASNGIPTHSISSTEDPTSPWYQQSKRSVEPGPDTDPTKPRPEFDLARIGSYAKSKNVRLWTWAHQGALRGRVEEAFAAYEKMGWSGLMVDFFDHDDQESVEFAEKVLQAAARHHLLVQLHGVWKPTGWERTYPNLMNSEGALNLEYLKWSDRCTPEHTLKMVFTRMIAGPMDYHLGGFRAVPRADFKPHHIAPNVLGTRSQMLAMYLCLDNPNPMLADYPTAYADQPGFEFLKTVPTWWDETRVLVGQIGEVIVTARRKGKIWYLGGMSAGAPREIDLPLSFLPHGKYSATIWRDSADAATDPNHLVKETEPVSAMTIFKARFAADGGFVAQIAPEAAR